jgi:acetyl-CoA synthetase
MFASAASTSLLGTAGATEFEQNLRQHSGKITVVAGISNFTSPGDITTLANPEIVDTIRTRVQTAKVARGDVPRALSAQDVEEIGKFGQAE